MHRNLAAATVRAVQRMTGRLSVALPPAAAFRLFTARGERDWVPGWEPRFAGDLDEDADDTAPGVVWETGRAGDEHDPHTIWLVIDSDPGRRVSYARVTPGGRAGTVTVALAEAPGGSDVEVTYAMTALTPAAGAELAAFAAGYADFLRSWETAIAAHLAAR
jgi:hypothetical protein